MNRRKLQDKCKEFIKANFPTKCNNLDCIQERTVYSRLFICFQIRPPKSTNKMRMAIRRWLEAGSLERASLIDCMVDQYEGSGCELPKRLLAPTSSPTASNDPHIQIICHLPGSKFYQTREWRELRYKALSTYGNRCKCCGASPRHGKLMHVDHIKPRSIFPEFALDINNLQVLCEDCNLGKSNTDQTAWA